MSDPSLIVTDDDCLGGLLQDRAGKSLRGNDLLVAFLFGQVREHEGEDHLRLFALAGGGRQIDRHQATVAGLQADLPTDRRRAGACEDGAERLLVGGRQVVPQGGTQCPESRSMLPPPISPCGISGVRRCAWPIFAARRMYYIVSFYEDGRV